MNEQNEKIFMKEYKPRKKLIEMVNLCFILRQDIDEKHCVGSASHTQRKNENNNKKKLLNVIMLKEFKNKNRCIKIQIN